MRGKALMPENRVIVRGITPAYAGKSLLFRHFLPGRWDHPRVCGEKYRGSVRAAQQKGSPPRMRGKEAIPDCCGFGLRITPAYAGKRWGRGVPSMRAWDHPRVCGEKAAYLRAVWVPRGSPPRMRGKAHKEEIWKAGYRITPAYAGKSSAFSLSHTCTKDHPRVCGEKCFFG